MLTIAVIGQKWLAAAALETVITLPGVMVEAASPPSGQDRLAKVAHEHGLSCYALRDCPPVDLALAVHCQEYIPPPVRERFRLGVLAYHPSLLPRHRGRDAVRWAVHMREPVTGGTLYWMAEGADTGPIEDQEPCHVYPGESPEELWRRALAPIGLRLITRTVTRLATGAPPRRTPQDERLATFEPSFTRKKLSQV